MPPFSNSFFTASYTEPLTVPAPCTAPTTVFNAVIVGLPNLATAPITPVPKNGTIEPRPCAKDCTGASTIAPRYAPISAFKLPDFSASVILASRCAISALRSGLYTLSNSLFFPSKYLDAALSAPNTSVTDLPAPTTP